MSDLRKSIVGILSKNDRPKYAGTGFFVVGGLIVTCAHVLDKARTLKGHFLYTMNERDGWLHAERVYLSETNELDIAVLRPLDLPSSPPPLRLISSRNSDLHSFKSFGYPSEGDGMGVHGDGHINNWRRDSLGRSALQISSDTVTHGFSGCPVWDNDLGGVVGMVRSGFNLDLDKKLGKVAFAIPSEILNQAYPDLPVEEVIDENVRLLADYRARLMDETRFVNLSGIPLHQGQRLDVPLDHVYIRLQAVEGKQRREHDEVEWRAVQDRAERDRTKSQDEPKDVLETLRTLGEFFYRRGEVVEAKKRPKPVDPHQALEKHKRLVILGAPGAGKSTLLRYLARRAAERTDGPLPIPVLLRDFATAMARDNSLSLREFALRRAAAGDADLRRVLEAEVTAGRVLWLVDALDEARSWAEDASKQAGQLPGQLLLTSRPVDYKGEGLERLAHFEVLPLQSEDVEQFLQNWFALLAELKETDVAWVKTRAAWLKAQLKERPRLRPLLRNPLLLTFLAILAGEDPQRELPAQRAELYRRYVEELLDSWESTRRIEHKAIQEKWAFDPDKLADERMRKTALDCFYYLGWVLHLAYYGGQPQGAPTREALAQRLALYLRPEWGSAAPGIAYAALDFWNKAGLVDGWNWSEAGLMENRHFNSADYLAFRHLTFQEYAAAWGLAEAWQRDPQRTWDFLKPRLHHYAWREPILLLVGLLEQKHLDDLTARLLRGQSTYEKDLHRDLLLAGELLTDAPALASQREIWRRLEQLSRQGLWRHKVFDLLVRIGSRSLLIFLAALRHKLRWIRREAADALGEIGDPQAVPVLITTALIDEDESVRWSAIWALGEIGNPQAIPALIKALQDEDGGRKRSAAEALGEIGDPQAIPYLIKALQDEDEYVRYDAARALGQIGDPQAIPALIRAIGDKSWMVSEDAVVALRKIDPTQILSVLMTAVQNEDVIVRGHAAKALGQTDDTQIVPILLTTLQDEHGFVRSNAAKALGEIGDPQATSALLTLLRNNNDDYEERDNVAAALEKIGLPAIPALLIALKDENAHMRRNVAKILGKIGSVQAIPSLIETLQDKEWFVSSMAATSLGRIGNSLATSALITALHHTRASVSAVCIALGQIGDPQAVPALTPILQSGGWGEKQNAAEALGQIGDPQAVPALITALNDKDESVCLSATWALGQIKDPRVIPALITALQHERVTVRCRAAKALGQIGNPQAVPALIAVPFDTFGPVNIEITKALGQIGDPQAVPTLITNLQDLYYSERRATAAVALGQIGGTQAIIALVAAMRDKEDDMHQSAASAAAALEQIASRQAVLQVQSLPLDDPLLEKSG